MTKFFFDYDALTGITEYFHMDEAGDNFWIESVQDTTPLLEANRQQFNEFNRADDRFGDEIGGRTKVASIPPVVVEDLTRRQIYQDKAKLAAWLDTAEAIPYRTRPGHVS